MSHSLPTKLSDGKAVNRIARPKTAPARAPKTTPNDIPVDHPLPYKVKVIREGESSSNLGISHSHSPHHQTKHKTPLDYTKPPVHHDSWRLIPTPLTGCIPSMKEDSAVSAIYENRYIYMFGGMGAKQRRLNSLYRFDTHKLQWDLLVVPGIQPFARSQHSLTLVGDTLVVYGGEGDFRGVCGSNRNTSLRTVYGDVWRYFIKENRWEPVSTYGKPPMKLLPVARRGHSATLISNNRILFCNGVGPESVKGRDSYLGEVWVLDLRSMIWEQPHMTGVSPSPRSRHTATIVHHNNLVIIGGGSERQDFGDIHVLNTDTFKWTKHLSPTLPNLQINLHVASINTQYPDKIYIFGGRRNHEMNPNSVISLDTKTMSFSVIHTSHNKDGPGARVAHVGCTLPLSNEVIIFSGNNALDGGGQWCNGYLHYLKFEEPPVVTKAPDPMSSDLNEKMDMWKSSHHSHSGTPNQSLARKESIVDDFVLPPSSVDMLLSSNVSKAAPVRYVDFKQSTLKRQSPSTEQSPDPLGVAWEAQRTAIETGSSISRKEEEDAALKVKRITTALIYGRKDLDKKSVKRSHSAASPFVYQDHKANAVFMLPGSSTKKKPATDMLAAIPSKQIEEKLFSGLKIDTAPNTVCWARKVSSTPLRSPLSSERRVHRCEAPVEDFAREFHIHVKPV